jgi:hypothetical protein
VGGGVGIKNGKLIRNSLQTMEKVYLNYRLEVLNKGGHSETARQALALDKSPSLRGLREAHRANVAAHRVRHGFA